MYMKLHKVCFCGLVTLLAACGGETDHRGKTPLVEVDGAFLYKEDFEKFLEGLKQTMQFIEQDNSFPLSDGAEPEKKPNLDVVDEANDSLKSDDIKIDIDF